MSLLTALGEGIYFLDAHYVAEQVAGIYIIKQQGSAAIIETGTVHSVPYIKQALSELNLSFDAVQFIIPTHIHLDHAGGAGELMQRCHHAQLLVHPRGARHMMNPEKLEAGTKAVYGDKQFEKLYGSLKPIDENRVTTIGDDEHIDFQGRDLHFIHTPGHAMHHFCIVDDLNSGVFTGDTFGLAYPQLQMNNEVFIFATTTPVHFDPDAMKHSIERILSFKPKRVFLTHFGAIEPNASVVAQLVKSIDAFVAIALKHRFESENRIELIQADIINWLLNELSAHSFDNQQLIKLLKVDSLLNAQGLDVWLQRQ